MRLFALTLALVLYTPLSFAFAGEKAGETPLITEPAENQTQSIEITRRNGTSSRFEVELAITQEEQRQGLMFRKSMPENHGMMFVFEDESPKTFWMKNTLIPLDILFIDTNGKIVKIHENAKPLDETKIPSDSPVFAAIELNGGTAARQGIASGDIVHHDTFGNSSSE